MTTGHRISDENWEIIHRIAREHHCDVSRGGNGHLACTVLGRYRQGDPLDQETMRSCLAAIKRATGLDTSNWLR
jgi:hypothetical protein